MSSQFPPMIFDSSSTYLQGFNALSLTLPGINPRIEPNQTSNIISIPPPKKKNEKQKRVLAAKQ